MIRRLKILQANKRQFPSRKELSESLKNDKALRKEVETLSKAFLYRSVSGCGNCYMDAYLELVNLPIEKMMQKQECLFELQRGKLLRDVINLDVSLNMTQANITNELSLYHLKTNPKSKQFFSRLPDNLDELLDGYKLPGEDSSLTEDELQLIDEIAVLLKAGETKTNIRDKYKDVEKVGSKKLTVALLNNFIKEAEKLNS